MILFPFFIIIINDSVIIVNGSENKLLLIKFTIEEKDK